VFISILIPSPSAAIFRPNEDGGTEQSPVNEKLGKICSSHGINLIQDDSQNEGFLVCGVKNQVFEAHRHKHQILYKLFISNFSWPYLCSHPDNKVGNPFSSMNFLCSVVSSICSIFDLHTNCVLRSTQKSQYKIPKFKSFWQAKRVNIYIGVKQNIGQNRYPCIVGILSSPPIPKSHILLYRPQFGCIFSLLLENTAKN